MILTSGAHTVTLRNPELGNLVRLDLRTQFVRTMDSTVYAYRATPVPNVHTLTFTHLTRQNVTDLAGLLDLCEEVTFASTAINIVGKVVNDPEFTSFARGLMQITLEVQV